ncbi:MAG: transcription antitermination protein NusB [Bacteroidales bacterium]|nr:transcription antitermination protein NusB [Bacteroidales bacterium]
MISRRLIRIKALHMLYSHNKREDGTLQNTESELLYSISKSHDLYHFMLLMLVEFREYANRKIDIAKNKNIPTFSDLNPNKKFIKNKLLLQLSEHIDLRSYVERHKLSWANQQIVFKKIYNDFIATDTFKEYMKNEEVSYAEDKKIIVHLLEKFLLVNKDLYSVLEEESIYWNDDIELIIGMVVRTVKKFKAEKPGHLMPLYRDSEDEGFAQKLIRHSVMNHHKHVTLIDKYIKNWEIERIAFIDILLMSLAISEAKEFTSIPIKVTLNEYIEIAKYYSTPKSGNFVNGILDRIFTDLRKEKVIVKAGRGLVGEKV